MNRIVIYKSKTGYTKTYAQWIGEALGCDVREAEDITVDYLKQYDVIIYGGGLYAVGINGVQLITQNFNDLKDKQIIVWATGSNPGEVEKTKRMWEKNFSLEQLQQIKTFYLRGGFDYKKLNPANKVLMNILKLKLKATKDRSEDEEGMLQAYQVPVYHCDKSNISQLVQYVTEL